MKKPYVCSICRRSNVKLWRPYMDTDPLVCARCAEERQTPREYDECTWEKADDLYIGTPTGKKIPLPKWEVDDEGIIPSDDGPRPGNLPELKTDQLIIDLNGESEAYASGETTMIPAIPDADGEFWGYTSVPEDSFKWWEELPM